MSSAALIIILLLAGDIESNPGPAKSNSCNGQIQNTAGTNSCVNCLRPIHLPCGFQIPDRPDMYCKVCFWTETSRAITSSISFQCRCQDTLKVLSGKIDQLMKRPAGSAVPERGTQQQMTQRAPPVSVNASGSNAQGSTPRTPRQRGTPTPARRLSFAEAARQGGNQLRASRQVRDKTPARAKPQNKPRGPSTGTSRLTSLKASEAEVPTRTQQKALFVTRLDKEHSEQDVISHLRKILPSETPIQVTKLRGENQEFYASFHVAVPADAFAEINDSSIWPLGAQFRQFRGQLRDYRKFGSDTRHQGNDPESPRRKMARVNPGRSDMDM